MEKTKRAIAFLQKAIALKQNFAPAYLYLPIAYYLEKNYTLSNPCYTKAIKLGIKTSY
jgi:tetratricopeptide (TPR) repeat protein